MNKDQIQKKIIPKSEVVVDGDLTIEKVTNLINLGREEECLDYKEMFDFSSRLTSKKSKVDLVCDIVSMANTDGGYILIGIKQNKNGTFSAEGVEEKYINIITQENVQNWVSSYIDAAPKILVKPVEYNGKNIIVICTFSAKTSIPFRQEGKYKTVHKKTSTKFHSGDLFVRHGAKSERANYENYINIENKIRADEKNKINKLENLNLLYSTENEIEDKVAHLISLQNTITSQRILKKEFNSIENFFKKQKDVKNFEELLEALNRTFIKFLVQLFVAWVTLIEYDGVSLYLAKQIVDFLHKLYSKANKINYEFEKKNIDSLWIQSRIIFLIYCLGAFAILQDKPEFAKLLLSKGNPFDESWKKRSWFKYILTMLSKNNRLEKNFCTLAFDFVKGNSYIINTFEGEEEIRNTLCQFDFLQCANNLLKRKDTHDSYPSFASFNKYRTEPIIEKIIDTCDKGLWIDKIDKSSCAKIINTLNKHESETNRFINWDYDEWSSKKIVGFLENYKNQS